MHGWFYSIHLIGRKSLPFLKKLDWRGSNSGPIVPPALQCETRETVKNSQKEEIVKLSSRQIVLKFPQNLPDQAFFYVRLDTVVYQMLYRGANSLNLSKQMKYCYISFMFKYCSMSTALERYRKQIQRMVWQIKCSSALTHRGDNSSMASTHRFVRRKYFGNMDQKT